MSGQSRFIPAQRCSRIPGAVPSGTVGLRWTSDDGNDDLNVVMDAWNGGAVGLQQPAMGRPDLLSQVQRLLAHRLRNLEHSRERCAEPQQSGGRSLIIAGGGTPFSPQFMPFNAPNAAVHWSAQQHRSRCALTCTADEQTFLVYINYSPNKLNNFSLRTEYFDDPQGQRTGVADALCRYGVELAALVVAADRDPSGGSPTTSRSTPRPSMAMSTRASLPPGTGRSSPRATSSFTSDNPGSSVLCDASHVQTWTCVATPKSLVACRTKCALKMTRACVAEGEICARAPLIALAYMFFLFFGPEVISTSYGYVGKVQ